MSNADTENAISYGNMLTDFVSHTAAVVGVPPIEASAGIVVCLARCLAMNAVNDFAKLDGFRAFDEFMGAPQVRDLFAAAFERERARALAKAKAEA